MGSRLRVLGARLIFFGGVKGSEFLRESAVAPVKVCAQVSLSRQPVERLKLVKLPEAPTADDFEMPSVKHQRIGFSIYNLI